MDLANAGNEVCTGVRTRVSRAAARSQPQRQVRRDTVAHPVPQRTDSDGFTIEMKKNTMKRLKANSWLQHQEKRLQQADTPRVKPRMPKGPVLDSAATVSVINKGHLKYADNIYALPKLSVQYLLSRGRVG